MTILSKGEVTDCSRCVTAYRRVIRKCSTTENHRGLRKVNHGWFGVGIPASFVGYLDWTICMSWSVKYTYMNVIRIILLQPPHRHYVGPVATFGAVLLDQAHRREWDIHRWTVHPEINDETFFIMKLNDTRTYPTCQCETRYVFEWGDISCGCTSKKRRSKMRKKRILWFRKEKLTFDLLQVMWSPYVRYLLKSSRSAMIGFQCCCEHANFRDWRKKRRDCCFIWWHVILMILSDIHCTNLPYESTSLVHKKQVEKVIGEQSP